MGEIRCPWCGAEMELDVGTVSGVTPAVRKYRYKCPKCGGASAWCMEKECAATNARLMYENRKKKAEDRNMIENMMPELPEKNVNKPKAAQSDKLVDVKIFDSPTDADLYVSEGMLDDDESMYVTFADVKYLDAMQLVALAIDNGKPVHIIPVED